MIQPALLLFGFYFLTSPVLRGAFGALGALVKFSPLVVLPLWSGYPDARDRRSRRSFVIGALVAAAEAFSIFLLDPRPWHGATAFVHHTFGYQFGRSSPFSLWDWRQYHAKGLPNLHWLQNVLQAALAIGAVALYRWPRYRSPLQMAAFTGVLLVGFEMVLTHWSWLYLEWFFPFVAFALLAPAGASRSVRHVNVDAYELAGPGPPVAPALDEHSLDPHVAARDLEPDGEAGREAAERPVGPASDDRVVRAGHPGVGDRGGPAG
jgi:hypothetical protein